MKQNNQMEDEVDKKIQKVISSKIIVPNSFINAIENCFKNYENKKKLQYHLFVKILATTCIGLIITTGIVYASTIIYDKIWKKPEKTVGFYYEENKITEQEKINTMSEKEAIEKANNILKKFGHEGEKITLVKLKNNSSDYELVWSIQTDNNTYIELDAKGGNDLLIYFKNILERNIKQYRTTMGKAKSTAQNLCKKYGYSLEKYNNITISSNLDSEDESYIWSVKYCKEYDGIINQYEKIDISFIPEINEIYSFIVRDKIYNENPLEISKEQAEQIALEAETKINSNFEFNNIQTELSIVKMNSDAYLRYSDYDKYYEQLLSDYSDKQYVEYRTDVYIRKAWKVKIKLLNNNKEFHNYYTYYIDATTGEIIGGEAA